ncbi:MAG: 5'/3'-nucleotidase SurE [Armatimonadetes bacterium]|nr:5'/3'-nucleotidase SurE [Armatimonadota bacterium]MDW8027811.1 5'/3'-nucleotidase SurE [Armatimonadota bacterium]
MGKGKPLILLSNDDGINAQGLMNLKRAMKKIGNVVVIAPDRPRSSCSHAITLHKPLRVFEQRDSDGDIVYACNGMPADCVILGIRVLCPRKPDLVIGGINEGPNLGDDIIYSGTVAVAREAALEGCCAFAISVAGFGSVKYDSASMVAQWLAKQLLKTKLPLGVFLNVNVPNLTLDEIKGLKITRSGFKHYVGQPEKRIDPQGRVYFWRGSEQPISTPLPDTDVGEVDKGFVSVTPLHVNTTFNDFLENLQDWERNFLKSMHIKHKR